MIAVFLAPLYILVNAYLFCKIMWWFKSWFPAFEKKKYWILPTILYVFFALSFLIAFFLPAGHFRRIMKLIGNYWLGVLLYIALTIIIVDLARIIIVRVLKIKFTSKRSNQIHRFVGIFCSVVIITTSILGVINARIVRVTSYDITVDKEAGDMDSLKVVLVADLHLGYNIGVSQMQRMVDKINKQDADLVVIAGDIFDNEWEAVGEPDKLAGVLRGIKSKYGVYACYGNHDIEEPILAGFTFGSKDKKQSSIEMDEFLENAGIKLLKDESVMIDDEIYLYGRPDARRPGRGITKRKTPSEITESMDKDKPIIVIDHEPSQLKALAKAGVDVDLCGHTHDGQLFPGNLTIKLMWENAYGYLKKGKMHNIVTSGVGLFGPNMRVGTKSEISVVNIHFKS